MRGLVVLRFRALCALACAALALPARAVPGPGVEPAPVAAKAKVDAPAALPADSAPPPKGNAWTEHFTLGGGIALYFYQPTNGWDSQFLVYSNLRFDAHFQPFGLHFEPRLSNEKLRPYYDGLAWIQEAYLYFEHDCFKLKVGKVYKQLGLFWDNSFYGNIQVYEGLKFDPNAGASLEGKFGERLGLAFWAQYFVIDGHTNASLTGRDTISIPGARRRNTVAGRVAPFARLSHHARLELGLSGEHFTADLPTAKHSVWRGAADAKLTWGGLAFWGEVLHQSGANVDAFPYPAEPSAKPPLAGRASAHNTYLLAGAEYALGPVVVRYDLSLVRYSDVSVEEVLHLPGLGVTFNENTSFLAEYAWWQRYAPEGSSQVDRSVNLTWMGHF
jgi:hypothetical protein